MTKVKSSKHVRINAALVISAALFIWLTLSTLFSVVNAVTLERTNVRYLVNTVKVLDTCIANHVPLDCASTYRSLYNYLRNAPKEHVNLVYAAEQLLDWEAVQTNDLSLIRNYVVSKSILTDMLPLSFTDTPDGIVQYERALQRQYMLAKQEAYDG
jgi:hypothetical protein